MYTFFILLRNDIFLQIRNRKFPIPLSEFRLQNSPNMLPDLIPNCQSKSRTFKSFESQRPLVAPARQKYRVFPGKLTELAGIWKGCQGK